MNFPVKNWYYQYRELFDIAEEKTFLEVSNNIFKQYLSLTDSWCTELNSEWTCRIYLSTKMILNATVLLKQLDFAIEKNIRVVVPYLEYYAVFSLLRCVIFTLPEMKWDDGKLIKISHTKSIKLTCDLLEKISPEKSQEVKSCCLQLKAQRELISYKSPASGDINLGVNYNIKQLSTLLAEVAQFNSELLEISVRQNTVDDTHILLDEHVFEVSHFNLKGFDFYDSEESHRLNYIRRKQPYPLNLNLFMTEGQSEDFIGAWDPDEYDSESEEFMFYSGSPSSWQDIFDIP